MKMITHKQLLESVHYDPETGIFIWLTKSTRAKAGDVAGCLYNGYRFIKIMQKKYAAHRLAWFYVYGSWPDQDIDHINGDRSDNAIKNLRDVPRMINAQNTHRARIDNLSSGLLGVTMVRRKWMAQIFVDGKNLRLGLFSRPEEAHQAYLSAKRQFHEGCTL
jgi:hypothetical protein